MDNITTRPLYRRERIPVPLEEEAEYTPESVWTLWKKNYLIT
jgi:hypothetical protein